MNSVDQILVRLGIDQSSVGPGLADFKAKVTETLHSIHRDFHKFQEQVKDSSGALGTAIRAIFSPLGAAIGGATMAFAYFRSQLDEFNRKADEMAEKAVKPMVDYREAAKKAAEEVNQAARAEKKWESEFSARHDKAKQSLEREIELLKIRGAWVDKAIDQEKNRQRDIRNAGLEAAVRSGSMLPETAAQLRREGDARDDYSANQAKLQARLDAMNPVIRGAVAARMAAGRGLEDANSAQSADRLAALDRARQLAEADEEARKAKADELSKVKVGAATEDTHGAGKFVSSGAGLVYIPPEMTPGDIKDSDKKVEALSKQLKDLTAAADKARKVYEDLKNAHDDDNDAVSLARENLEKKMTDEDRLLKERTDLQNQLKLPFMAPGAIPFTPSYAQPSFSDYLNTKGPYQNIAQRLNSNEEAAKYWSVQGRPDIAQQYIQANEGRDVMVNRMGEEVSGDELAFESRGSYFGIHQEHRAGLRDRLPKIATQQGETDYLRNIDRNIEALRQSGCGAGTVSDGLKIIPADVR